MLGALLIGIVRNGLVLAGVDIYGQTMVSGLIIIVAVAVDAAYRRRSFHLAWLVHVRRALGLASDHHRDDDLVAAGLWSSNDSELNQDRQPQGKEPEEVT